MKNLKDFFSSVIAYAIVGGILALIYLIAAPFALIWLVLFISLSSLSVAFLALLWMFGKAHLLFPKEAPRRILAPTTVAITSE
ncbi:MAG: hypothetical protein Q7R93_02765 [bacterium]|nr:hypothetical protein [bacterium]